MSHGGISMTLRRFQAALAVLLGLLAPFAVATAAAAAPGDTGTARPHARCWWGPLITNGSFETPAVTSPNTWILTPGGGTVGWQTTDPQNSVELWGPNMGVPPFDGTQFSEINANAIDTIYQDVPTVPGTLVFWRLAHRARNTTPGADVDRMQVVVGPPSGTTAAVRPFGQFSPVIASGESRWDVRSGAFVVPPGQWVTRIGFQSLTGPAGYGNLIDGVTVIGRVCRTRPVV